MRDPSERDPFEAIAGLDKLVHEPARLAVLTALSACEEASFLYLRRLTGLTKGNLSSHLSKLEDAGLVEVRKTFEGKKPATYVALTGAGREAVAAYWDRMETLRDGAREWVPEEPSSDAPGGS
jgi:DNA-binding MarR family transcriptional regulator